MNWGDASAFLSLPISAVAALYAIKARGDSRRSADAAVRSAQAEEAALQLQQAAAQPAVVLRIRGSAPGIYRLVNGGDMAARNLSIHAADAGTVLWDPAPPGDLEPGDSREFLAATPANKPSRLRFTWDGQQRPVHVDWP